MPCLSHGAQAHVLNSISTAYQLPVNHPMLLTNKTLIRFGDYEIDRLQWTVRWRQQPIALKRKSMDVLLYLVDHRNRVISKEELLQTLWAGQFVEDGNLT